jgi:hypothetical protein
MVLGGCRLSPPMADDYVLVTGTEGEGSTTATEGSSDATGSTGGTDGEDGTSGEDGTESTGVEDEPVCGDGVVEGDEECDDGGASPTCSADCTVMQVFCGDGLVNVAGEECDDGGESMICDFDCTTVVCGDGLVNMAAGEDCDDAGESMTCNVNCSSSSCGDGITNVTAGESCDGVGESASCDDDCTLAMCGDGLVNMTANEGCDDGGESVACNVGCTPATCGDGVFNATAGELCDQGGPTALCDADCTPVACGDGFVNMVAGEDCDDAGESMACNMDCSIANCGDGITNATAGESCDDMGESMSCNVDCTPSSCGDGILNAAAAEQCDDAGESAACDADCSAAVCNDGLTNTTAGEACEGTDLAGATCVSLGFDSGILACNGSCAFDTTSCHRPSCQDILDADPTMVSGLYELDVDGNGPIPPFQTYCDMDTDGGGWTELTLALGCTLGGEMIAVQSATTHGIDAECRPFTLDSGAEVHTYHYTIPFPPGFSQIMPVDYVARANAAAGDVSDISNLFAQMLWTQANNGSGYGDISFGAAEQPGPITTFSAAGVAIMCLNCEVPYPGNGLVYTLGMESQALRIGWGEAGGQSEGWYPWWSGTLRVR